MKGSLNARVPLQERTYTTIPSEGIPARRADAITAALWVEGDQGFGLISTCLDDTGYPLTISYAKRSCLPSVYDSSRELDVACGHEEE
jgi:hypothetical protein